VDSRSDCDPGRVRDSRLQGLRSAAETRRFSYEVYQPRDEAETVFRHDQADWVVAGEPQRIPASHLVSAGSAEGRALFALVTDAAPYDRLYVETAGAWTPFARVN
jgi:hypothetical protein